MNYYTQNAFTVQKAIMVETAGYDEQFLRPYVTHYDAQIQNVIQEATRGGQNISPQSLTPAASNMMQPSTEPTSSAKIFNGFNEKRLSFMIEIKVNNSTLGNDSRFILTGYTDHLGVSSISGINIDPNMVMVFNNVFAIRDTLVDTPNGKAIKSNLIDAKHVLYNYQSHDYLGNQDQRFMVRPSDVAAQLEVQDSPLLNQTGLYDGRYLLDGVKTSSMAWGSRPKYLSRSLESFKYAQVEDANYDQDVDNTVWNSMRDHLNDEPVSKNPFFTTLFNVTNFMNNGFVTYSELCHVLPDLDFHNQVFLSSGVQKQQLYQPGMGADWSGMDAETIAATVVQQFTPSIMADCLFTSIGFAATNDVIGGTDQVNVHKNHSFTEGIDLSDHIVYFIERLKREVLVDVSKYGHRSYHLYVDMNMMYDSHVWVSIDGQETVYFASPCFCNALYTPILSSDRSTMESLAQDLSTMMYNVNGDLNRMVQDSPSVHQSPSNPITSL